MATATLTLPGPTEMPKRATTPTLTQPPQRGGLTLATLERIVLTGFMGSGKTTTGRLLAERLGWRFLDLDHEIERREGLTVPGIFAERGEAAFRRAEYAALAELLGTHHAVLALGGGAPETLGNRLLLEQTPRTAVVHLAAPFHTLVARCLSQPGATERPVLADLDTARHRFDARLRHYERIASHTVETAALSPEAVAESIVKLLA